MKKTILVRRETLRSLTDHAVEGAKGGTASFGWDYYLAQRLAERLRNQVTGHCGHTQNAWCGTGGISDMCQEP